MKKLITLFCIASIALLTGCSTPGKLIASSSSAVSHAMQAWAVYAVDGKATPAQEAKVKELQANYYAAEDLATDAYIEFSKTKDTTAWNNAKNFLLSQQTALINIINLFSTKEAK